MPDTTDTDTHMAMNFRQLMQDATCMTRAGDPRGATRAIRRALAWPAPNRASAWTGKKARAEPVSPVGKRDARVIDAEFTRSAGAGQQESANVAGDLQERVLRARHSDAKGKLDYRLFVPARAENAPPPPLLVMLHGCTQQAEDFSIGTRMDHLARQHGFLVLYPEQTDRANAQRCWNWFKHSHQRRGGGEAGRIERCVRSVIDEHGADPSRVYVAGLSAGGAMAAILGSVCPDLFKAIGVHSGLAAGAASNLPEALSAMQRGGSPNAARIAAGGALPPTIVFHGDADRTVHPDNGEYVIEACVVAASGAANAANVGSKSATVAPSPVTFERAAKGGNRGWTQRVHRGADGKVVAEHWCVHGAGHAWSGGDARGSYTDNAGPDASAEMLRFFLEN